MKKQRIAACIGLVFIIVSVLCVISVGFIPHFRDLLMAVSTVTFLIAVTILGILVHQRKAQAEEKQQDDSPKEA